MSLRTGDRAAGDSRRLPYRMSGLIMPAALVLLPGDAHAMHIAEGILPLHHALLSGVLLLPFLALGLRTMSDMKSRNPLFFSMTGLMGAAVFVLSAFPIPIPFAGTCSHPAGTGLSAIFLGPLISTVVAFIALLIQGLFMAHGGITTLGANTLSMGVCGSFSGWLAYRFMRTAGLSLFTAGFAAGAVADLVTYAATSAILAFSITDNFTRSFLEIGAAFLPTQLPLCVLEGVITGSAVRYVFRHKPELLDIERTITMEAVNREE